MYITNEKVRPFLDWAVFDPDSKQLLAASVFSRTAEARNFCAHLQLSLIHIFSRNQTRKRKLILPQF